MSSNNKTYNTLEEWKAAFTHHCVIKPNNMRHVEKAARNFFEEYGVNEFIEIENTDDIKGVAPIVRFTIQSDPIGEVGVNGLQALDMLKYVKCLFESLNEAFPCRENAITITKIEEAIHWQDARTKDRERLKKKGGD